MADLDMMTMVRLDLCRRIAALDAVAAVSRTSDLARELDAIRGIALRNGMQPVVTVAKLLDSVLSRGEHGALFRDWLSVLAEAAGCERSDAATSDAYAAACSVRLAS